MADANKILVCKLEEIYVDPSWNVRSGNWTEQTDPETGSGFTTLKLSIETEGQREPVTVRPYKHAKNPAIQYALVAGFRRYAALKALNSATIRCTVEDLDDKAARYRNLAENTARESLKGADLAWGIGDLIKMGETDVAIAKRVGRHQTYIGRLHKIVADLKPALFSQWRAATVDITVADAFKVATAPKDRQDEVWNEIIKARTPEVLDGKGKAAKVLVGLRKRGESFGRLLGLLQRDGHIKNVAGDWDEVALLVLPVPKKVTSKQVASIGKALATGYANGQEEERIEDEDSEETEEENGEE